MIWLVSLAYGAAVLVVATALVLAIIWSVEKLAVKDRHRAHVRTYRLMKWLGSSVPSQKFATLASHKIRIAAPR
jgi:hypothetical protein